MNLIYVFVSLIFCFAAGLGQLPRPAGVPEAPVAGDRGPLFYPHLGPAFLAPVLDPSADLLQIKGVGASQDQFPYPQAYLAQRFGLPER